jgi:hypothetical protein
MQQVRRIRLRLGKRLELGLAATRTRLALVKPGEINGLKEWKTPVSISDFFANTSNQSNAWLGRSSKGAQQSRTVGAAVREDGQEIADEKPYHFCGEPYDSNR